MKVLVGIGLTLIMASQALANAPATSPHPLRRPGAAISVPAASHAPTNAAVLVSPFPIRRPDGLVQRQSPRPARANQRGSICGVRQIQGQTISAIPGKLAGCGVANPVRVTSVSGVTLSQAAVMDCTTAKALNLWVERGVKPAVGRLGGGASELRVVAHYACRTRNNKPGAKISEHGKGHAIDIAGVTLKNGATLSVLKGWRDPVQGKALKAMHAAACGTFGTVLGPNADRYHQDHLHLDTARYRSGSYCR